MPNNTKEDVSIVTAKHYADMTGLSHSYVRQLLRENRIRGAYNTGRDWLIVDPPPKNRKNAFMSVSEVAKKVGKSNSHIRRLLRKEGLFGWYKGKKIGRDWYVIDPSLLQFLNSI